MLKTEKTTKAKLFEGVNEGINKCIKILSKNLNI